METMAGTSKAMELGDVAAWKMANQEQDNRLVPAMDQSPKYGEREVDRSEKKGKAPQMQVSNPDKRIVLAGQVI